MSTTAAGPSATEGAGGGPKVFQFKVELKDTNPVIWRRFQVKADPEMKFWDLHVAIQAVMGWEDKHIHRFRITNPENGRSVCIGEQRPGDGWSMMKEAMKMPGYRENLAARGLPTDIFDLNGKVFTEWKIPLSKYYYDSEASRKFVTEYTLYWNCDNWEHNVTFEGCFPAEPDQVYPRCLEGERANILEYLGLHRAQRIRDLHKSLALPGRKRSKDELEALEWLHKNKPNYDPAKFDPDEVVFRDSQLWLATHKKKRCTK